LKNRILGIEKSERLLNTIAKYFTMKMDVINIPTTNRDFLLFKKSLIFFKSKKLSEQIDELNNIKNNYDLCIVSSWDAAKLAFLCDMKFIFYFIGDDIRNPEFSKKITVENTTTSNFSKHKPFTHNDIFEKALVCVTGSEELFSILKNYRSDSIRIDRTIVDRSIFHRKIKPINIKKHKFTFLSPTRIGSEKGIDLLWNAVKLCTSDFNILQINWIDEKNQYIKNESKKILQKKPSNVYLIDKIKHEDMGKYYVFADCILGEMKTGHTNSIEREAALCHKPILNYNNLETKSFLDGKELVTPFLPHSNHPKEIAKLIDKIVIDKKFCDTLAKKEYEFMKNLTDPQKTVGEWENLINNLM
jgi:glycosyltransferase involved in cell wall biosynthesis